jgi:hypothetical protein
MPGTQAQKVRCTLAEEQFAPASTLSAELVALGLALTLALVPALALALAVVDVLDGVEDELLLQAASSDSADAPAMTGRACRIRVLILPGLPVSASFVVFIGASAPLRGR